MNLDNSTANIMHTRLQNYTMSVGEHRIQIFEAVLLFSCRRLMFLSPQVHIPSYFWTSELSKYSYISNGLLYETFVKQNCSHKVKDHVRTTGPSSI